MEEALRAGEEKYRSAMILGRMGSWEVDFVKGVRIWTPEGMDLFGINLVDGLGHVGGETDELHRAMHSEDRHLLARYHALADSQTHSQPSTVLRPRMVRSVGCQVMVGCSTGNRTAGLVVWPMSPRT